jgi:hypothetical protein
VLNIVTVTNGEPVGHYNLQIGPIGSIGYNGPLAGFAEHLSGSTPEKAAVSGDNELCPVTGLYMFRMGGMTLRFSPVHDPCPARISLLTLGAWNYVG